MHRLSGLRQTVSCGSVIRSVVRISLVGATLFVLGSCDAFKTPFGLQIQAINDVGPQHPAAISIGDPQIFKRETLVNDRLREVRLIKKLLEESSNITGAKDFRRKFLPDLVRDTVTITSIATQLSAAFDPAKGKSFRRQDRLDNVQAKIDETKLQTKLVMAENELKKAEEANAEASLTDNNGDTEKPKDGEEEGDAAQKLPAPAVASQNEEVKNIKNEPSGENQKSNESGNPSTAEIRKAAKEGFERGRAELATLVERAKAQGHLVARSDLLGSPTDQFRDLQAYRAELRQELAALNLDDAHDHNGNALYRLQQLATVKPGQHKDKYGVARLTFLPPVLTEDEIGDLYFTWLNHLTYRMNPPLPAGRAFQNDLRFGRLASTGLFRMLKLNFSKYAAKGGACKSLAKTKKPSMDEIKKLPTLLIAVPASKTGLSYLADLDNRNDPYEDTQAQWMDGYVQAMVAQATSELADWDHRRFLEACGAIIFNNRPGGGTRPDVPEIFTAKLTEKYDWPVADTPVKLGLLAEKQEIKEGSPPPPKQFRTHDPVLINSIVQKPAGVSNFELVAKGSAYSYNVRPKEVAQRISTITRNANSMEFAMSLAAAFPTKGLTGQLDTSFMRTAAGNAEALERLNLVVGFVDRRSPLEMVQIGRSDPIYLSRFQAPQAGWVFAPPAHLNPGEGRLERIHTVKAHPVALDLSVPGWWPRVQVEKETAWIGNWNNTSRTIRLADEPGQGYHKEWYEVSLPWKKRSNLDGLTELLSSMTSGGAVKLTSVRHVEPYFINACSKDTVINIEGANIWRSTEIYLAGMAAEEIRILPDMEGVSAKFDLNKLYASNNSHIQGLGTSQTMPLTIWTRDGQETMSIGIDGTRDSKGNCAAPRGLAFKRLPGKFAILETTPTRLSLCAPNASFLVKVIGKKGRDATFFLNGTKATNADLVGSKNRGVYHVSFPKDVVERSKFQANAVLSATDGEVLSSMAIALDKCEAKKGGEGAGPVAPRLSEPDFKLPKLAAIGNFIIDGDTTAATVSLNKLGFRLISGKLPDRKLRLVVWPKNHTRKDWVQASGKPIVDPVDTKNFTNNISIPKSNVTLYPSLTSGRELNLSIQAFRKEDSAGYDEIPIAGRPVFYESAADANIGLKTTTVPDISKAGLKVLLKLPVKAALAYPALKLTGIGLTAKFKAQAAIPDLSNGTIELKISGGKFDPAKNIYEATIGFQNGFDTYTAMRASTGKAKSLIVNLEFKNAKGTVPTIHDLTISAPP